MKKYNIIYADPPWHYSQPSHRPNGNFKFRGGADKHYKTMKVSEIKELELWSITEENCYLFLWATFPNLPVAFEVIKAWGFKYRTLGFSWIKTNKKNEKPFFGIGYYTKSNCEVCLLATRGKPKPISNSVSSVLISPLMGHSQKPAIVRDKIVELCGDLPRVELFARQKVDGWDSWGNEIESDLVLPSEADK